MLIIKAVRELTSDKMAAQVRNQQNTNVLIIINNRYAYLEGRISGNKPRITGTSINTFGQIA